MSLILNDIEDVRAISADLFSRGKTREEVVKMLNDLQLVAIDLGRHKSACVLEVVAAEVFVGQTQAVVSVT